MTPAIVFQHLTPAAVVYCEDGNDQYCNQLQHDSKIKVLCRLRLLSTVYEHKKKSIFKIVSDCIFFG